MRQKSNLLWIAIPIVGAIIFVVWLLLPYKNSIEIELAAPRPTPTAPASGGATVQGAIELTPATVKNVVASLARPERYTAEFSVKLFWRTGSSEFPVTLSVDSGSITVNGTEYSRSEYGQEAQDAIAMLPTYEDIMELDPDDILRTAYAEYEGKPYIYVRFNGLMYVHDYWISIQSGLLEHATKYDGNTLVYEMHIVG